MTASKPTVRASRTDTRKNSRTNPIDFAPSISFQEKVALLAYSYWEKRGCQGGSSEEDWYRAEREVLSHMNMTEQ